MRACHVDDQDERSVSSHLLRAGDLLRFVLPRQRDLGHCRHGVRRLPQTGSARGRRRRTGACVYPVHSLANWDSCPTPAKSEVIEYLQVGPTEIRYSIAWTIFVYLQRSQRKQKYGQI